MARTVRQVAGAAFVRADVAAQPGTAVTVGATSLEVAAANKDRVEITIQNDHASQVVYLKLGATAVANEGIRLNAGGGSWSSSAYTGAINAIATGAGTEVLVTEV